MKIIKVLSKKVKDAEYHKYIVTLPKEAVEKSELLGKSVKAEAEKGKICIVKEKN